MNLTPHHAKYFAHELTKRCSSQSAAPLTGAVASAQANRAGMTLRPHHSSGGGHRRDADGFPPLRSPSPESRTGKRCISQPAGMHAKSCRARNDVDLEVSFQNPCHPTQETGRLILAWGNSSTSPKVS
jgi:hypothetical protein